MYEAIATDIGNDFDSFKLKYTKMSNIKRGLKKKVSNKNGQTKDVVNTYIQPFKEMPSVDNTGQESGGRINANELFSHYTADIINEDIVFTR